MAWGLGGAYACRGVGEAMNLQISLTDIDRKRIVVSSTHGGDRENEGN